MVLLEMKPPLPGEGKTLGLLPDGVRNSRVLQGPGATKVPDAPIAFSCGRLALATEQ